MCTCVHGRTCTHVHTPVHMHTHAVYESRFLQGHHAAREVFLSQDTDENEAACLLRTACVCDPASFAANADAGDDVFLFEYEYDTIWKVGMCLG